MAERSNGAPNALLRATRNQLHSPTGSGRVMSRQELAEAVNAYLAARHGMRCALDETYVGKLERGEHRWPNEKYREAFRAVLGVDTDAELGFFIIRGTVGHSMAEAAEVPSQEQLGRARFLRPLPDHAELDDLEQAVWTAPDAAELIGRFTRRDLVERRDAARVIAGLTVGATLLAPLQRWLTHKATPVGGRGRRPGFGVQEVEQIEATVRAFRSWDDRFGGGLRRKAVIGQLCEVADMLDGTAMTPLTRRLYSAMAQLAGTAATASWDCGRQRLAQQYYLLGLRAAREADDRAFGANLLAGLARQLLYLGKNKDALDLVRQAETWSRGHATAKVQSMLATREAWAYANQGQIAAFRRATARAEDILASTKPDEDHPYWIEYFDQAELAGVTGGRLLQLAHRKPDLAAETADYIDHAIKLRRGERLRSSALDRIGVAEARLLDGEVEEACRLGHVAADVAEQTPSDRVRVKLREFATCLDDGPRTTGVVELRQRLIGILRTPVPA